MTQLNKPVVVRTTLGGRELTIESGRFAKQADGAVYIRLGDTSALVTVVSAPEQKPDVDFFPMTIEFQEKFYAAGKIPGGFFKREAKPSDWATLNARMVDRPLRPLFPKGYRREVQVVLTLLSSDRQNPGDVWGTTAASIVLGMSKIPFNTPVASVRVKEASRASRPTWSAPAASSSSSPASARSPGSTSTGRRTSTSSTSSASSRRRPSKDC